MLLVDIVLRRSADGPRVIRCGDEFPCCTETVNSLEGLTRNPRARWAIIDVYKVIFL